MFSISIYDSLQYKTDVMQATTPVESCAAAAMNLALLCLIGTTSLFHSSSGTFNIHSYLINLWLPFYPFLFSDELLTNNLVEIALIIKKSSSLVYVEAH